MQFIDESTIFIKAGSGGDGCASFRREKFIERGGPDGGDGGTGGSVVLQANSHHNTLLQFRFKKHFQAEKGENGKGQNKTGRSRKPLVLQVPVGTQVYSSEGQLLIYDFTKDLEEFEIIPGGRGGLGNTHFKSSINQSPRRKTPGESGAEMEVHLQLKLLSDAGLVGLPNAGKSTFLDRTTSAKPKIANYAFTTIKPQLGVVRVGEEEFVLADIPGLIRGAHLGSGLGDKFLKHIERCGVLLHLIDASSEDVAQDYQIIRNELESYSNSLKSKKEIICLNKIDILDEEQIQEKMLILNKLSGQKIYAISTFHQIGIDSLLKNALEIIKEFRDVGFIK